MLDDSLPSNHGGLVFPLDMFRPTMLAAGLAEGLISQARNILDAKLEIIRHPEVQIVLVRLHGSVIGDDPATFWRENVELGLIASQVLPRQLFLYWVSGAPSPRQGFIVTQRGQMVHAQDATPDSLPEDATPQDWPVAQLLTQLQLTPDELAGGFAGGPRIELSLMEPEGDDRELLMTLVGQQPGAEDGEGQSVGAPPPEAAENAAPQPKRLTVEDDKKRRAQAAQAEAEARQAKANSVHADLPYLIDDIGIVVAPKGAELADTDILGPFMAATIEGDLPAGVDHSLTDQLMGKRVDFAVPVEFLSEVFGLEGPLTKAAFVENSEERVMGDAKVRVLEVLGPRLGRGSFIRRERAGVFVSRTPDLQLPIELITKLLDQQG